jgi:hypothetical protein
MPKYFPEVWQIKSYVRSDARRSSGDFIGYLCMIKDTQIKPNEDGLFRGVTTLLAPVGTHNKVIRITHYGVILEQVEIP